MNISDTENEIYSHKSFTLLKEMQISHLRTKNTRVDVLISFNE